MTEKITGQGLRPTDMTGSTRRPEGTQAAGTTSSSTASTTSTEDTVNVSRSSLLLSELERAVAALPVVDANRVETLKQAIESGQYEVDSQSLADSIMRIEQELS